MRVLLKHISPIILIFLMLICFATSIGYAGKLSRRNDISMLYLEDNPLTVSELLRIQAEELKTDTPTTFTGWAQKNDQDLYNPDFNRHRSADVVYLWGNSSLVFDSVVSLKEGDESGCLVSEDTAYDLFGGTNVKGYKILLGNRELTIQGLLGKEEKETIVVQAVKQPNKNIGSKNSGEMKSSDAEKPADTAESTGASNTAETDNAIKGIEEYENEEVTIKTISVATEGLDEIEREKAVNKFTDRNGISAKTLDYQIYKSMSNIFAYLLPIIITLIITATFIKKAVVSKNKPVICFLYAAEAFVALLTAIYIYNFHLTIPPSMIPNRWSDFDFWQTWFHNFSKEFELLVYSLKQIPEKEYLIPSIRSMFFSILSIIFFFISNTYIKIDSALKVFFLSCLSLVIEFIINIHLNSSMSMNVNLTALWLMYPYFLVWKYIIKKTNTIILTQFVDI